MRLFERLFLLSVVAWAATSCSTGFYSSSGNGFDDLYIFFANPAAQRLTYPLRYGQAFEDKGSKREVVINTDDGARPLTLEFKPNESLMVKATDEGDVEIIDLGFTAKKIE